MNLWPIQYTNYLFCKLLKIEVNMTDLKKIKYQGQFAKNKRELWSLEYPNSFITTYRTFKQS